MKIEMHKTSRDLFVSYASESGVSIHCTSVNLDLGVGNSRDGTILTSISALAGVTKAEMYDNGNGLVIRPREFITVEGTPIDEDLIFDVVQNSKTVENNGLGKVVIGEPGRDGGTGGSEIGEEQAMLKVDVDSNNGFISIAFSPEQQCCEC